MRRRTRVSRCRNAEIIATLPPESVAKREKAREHAAQKFVWSAWCPVRCTHATDEYNAREMISNGVICSTRINASVRVLLLQYRLGFAVVVVVVVGETAVFFSKFVSPKSILLPGGLASKDSETKLVINIVFDYHHLSAIRRIVGILVKFPLRVDTCRKKKKNVE